MVILGRQSYFVLFVCLAIQLLSRKLVLSFVYVPPDARIGHQSSCESELLTPSSYRTTELYLDGKGMAGQTFNKHLVGDVIRALQPRNLKKAAEALQANLKGPRKIVMNDAEIKELSRTAPSWDDLSKLLKKQQTKEEINFRAKLSNGEIHSPLASMRLFGSDTKPRTTFYRDHASWCPYCQKVWIALEEKQVSYEIIKVDMNCYAGENGKPADFLRIQPTGTLPCAIIQDDDSQSRVISESDQIIDVIDSMGRIGTPKLRPVNSDLLERMTFLCDNGQYNSLERKLYREWLWYLTGKRKPVEYRQRFEFQLAQVNKALGETEGPYFMGKELSLADIKFIPFVERMVASIAYFKGWNIREEDRRENINTWLIAMESRPSYRATKSDYYTHSRALPPQLAAGCVSESTSDAKRMQTDIDALSEAGYTKAYPLDWKEPGWDQYAQGESARREAAERILNNYVKIVRFASRAAGTPGIPAASAPLADPRASINEAVVPIVDTFLRHVVYNLLQPYSRSSVSSVGLAESLKLIASSQDKENVIEVVVECLNYLRARVGVPRDMTYPAATEFRLEILSVVNLVSAS